MEILLTFFTILGGIAAIWYFIEKAKDHKKIIGKDDYSFRKQKGDDLIRKKYTDYKIITRSFWKKVKQETDKEHLYLFYTNTDSSPVRLLDVIANDFYVINEKADNEILDYLNEGLQNQYALIKIISRGGEGKSTFLYHLGKKYCDNYNVIVLDNFNRELLMELEEEFQNVVPPKPFLFLLDNPALLEEELIQSTPKLISRFRSKGFVLIVAEREFRYNNFEAKLDFENNFNRVYTINYKSFNLKEKIFDILFSSFMTYYNVPESLREDAKSIYLEDKRKSLSESTFSVINEIVKRTGIKFIFDWIDWEKYTKDKAPKLNDLYLIIATFFQFGFSLKVDFCAKFLDNINSRAIIKFIGESYNLPIYIRRNNLFLRHETIASWYINDSKQNMIMSSDLFEEFLNNINTDYEKDILIWIYKHKEFQKSYLSNSFNSLSKLFK
ncbi:MAG: hypothetical protein IIC75_03045 [Bacteroidetes bacterium]|nr:hypothetical protein [Bacteroidota bacterium]